MMRKVIPFILCGGSGTRLWPLSREAFPKQFHKLTGDASLFQQTSQRLNGDLFGQPTVLSSQQHRFIVAEQLAEIGLDSTSILLEPTGRNTGPAACVAALVAFEADKDSLVLLAPSDHVIPDAEGFARAIERGIEAAEEGALVTFGVEPDCPHTGYGYIQVDKTDTAAYAVERFVEKPSRELAEEYLAKDNFLWNAGIFLFSAAMLIEMFEKHAPEILAACRSALDRSSEDLGARLLDESYSEAPGISLDYAIAEKASNIRCVPLDLGWSDVGSWSALWDYMEKNSDGNVIQGDGEVILENVRDSYVYGDHGYVTLVGVDNLIVVAMEDAVLVASKSEAESIRKVVDLIKANGHYQASQHTRVYRPWGWYQGLNKGERYQVKCIMVKPKGKLSLQSHHHRSEHWVVVTGTVEVTRGEEVTLLSENQSTYIPIGEKHRLANPGKIPAFLIEVQSGPYLDEDDIIRYEDVYGRSSDA